MNNIKILGVAEIFATLLRKFRKEKALDLEIDLIEIKLYLEQEIKKQLHVKKVLDKVENEAYILNKENK